MEFVKRCTSGCKTNYLDGMDLMVIEAVAAVAQWAIKVNKIAIMKKKLVKTTSFLNILC